MMIIPLSMQGYHGYLRKISPQSSGKPGEYRLLADYSDSLSMASRTGASASMVAQVVGSKEICT